MLTRICSICGQIHPQGQPCPQASKRHKEYDTEHRNKGAARIYHGTTWRRLRRIIMAMANGLDEYELYANNHIVKADTVHHIEPLEDEPGKAYDITNLIAVSRKTHAKIHEAYNRSEADSSAIKNMLKRIAGQHTGGGV
ncbi:HNH endonuclease signature motif containing protein [Megasphaera hexanoica]|uniref:HNH endonuclease signature motif containing protein n=1 Tax=Megasphaera hexanoica TaxID=1675036 RepID=UPI000DEB9276|nr:HNH endonuclease signature motif containing protein [Megasphaera hexanoica]AXB80889.1 hypothetical protein ACT01_00730 [Megasphaera hexanoica]